METLKITHVNVSSFDFRNYSPIELATIDDFTGALKTLDVKVVMVIKEKPGRSWFAFTHGNNLYKISSAGFRSIHDYLDAREKKLNSWEYDNWRNSGLPFEEFDAKRNHFPTTQDYLDAKEYGILDGFPSLFHGLSLPLELKGVKTAGDFYCWFLKSGFEKFEDFPKAAKRGFFRGQDYYAATSKGIESYKEFDEFRISGYDSVEEMRKAREMGIRTKKEDQLFQFKKKFGFDTTYTDEIYLLKILEDLASGRKISINDLLENLVVEERDAFPLGLPKSYAKGIKSVQHLHRFMQSNPAVKIIGVYDSEGKFFQKNSSVKFSEKEFVLDLSNIAWNGKEKPQVRCIEAVVNFLVSKGVKNIIGIADAALEYTIDDKADFQKLMKTIKYIKAPAKTDADDFIIKIAREDNAFIITNDQFKDYIEKDEWVKNNIERLRIPFIVNDDKVHLSGDFEKLL